MKYVRMENGAVVGVYGCPQPDAYDGKGNLVAKGAETVEMEDSDPRIAAFYASLAEQD